MTSIKPLVPSVRPIPSPTNNPGIAAEKHKRSQRVLLRVRAQLHVAVKGKEITIDAATVSVNPQGALVVMKESLAPETRLIIEHSHTKEKVAARVTRPAKEMPEGFHVPIEFDAPAPGFWKIAFPPSDWMGD
jgi:hypothetical protein